jgi:hypothetical protein
MPDAGESQPPGAWLPQERPRLGFGLSRTTLLFRASRKPSLPKRHAQKSGVCIGDGTAAVTSGHNFLGRALGQDSIGNRARDEYLTIIDP